MWRAASLSLMLALCACTDDEVPIFDPCEVSVAQSATLELNKAGLDALERQEYWRQGPYFTWNTAPAAECRDNPKTSAQSIAPGTELRITYPAANQSAISGHSNIAPGSWPMIVFSHANNDSVCNIFERYQSLHEHWASWGFVVVSVNDTESNCQRGNRQNIIDRSQRQLAAIDALKALNDDPQSVFFKAIDTSKVVLAGHSRGGGASLVSWQNHTPQDEIKAIIDLQGIDMTSFGFGSPPITVPVMGISASRDVDLDYPYVEPTEEQLKAPYSWVTIYGGIHAYTADTVPIEPDDTPKIPQQVQHDITEYMTTAFLAHHVGLGRAQDETRVEAGSAASLLYTHQGAQVVQARLSSLGIATRWNTFDDAQRLIDDFEGPRSDKDPALNLLGGQNLCEDLLQCDEVSTYEPDKVTPSAMYAKAYSRRLKAPQTPMRAGQFTMTLPSPSEPLTDTALFQARVKAHDDNPHADFLIHLHTEGGVKSVKGADHIGPAPLSNRYTQLVIPLSDLKGQRLTKITVELVSGGLFVDDPRYQL